MARMTNDDTYQYTIHDIARRDEFKRLLRENGICYKVEIIKAAKYKYYAVTINWYDKTTADGLMKQAFENLRGKNSGMEL